MSETSVSAILDLLATHGHMPCSQTTPTVSAWWAQCYGCDWKGPRRSHSNQRDADHREHVAEVIARIVAERVRVVEGERDAIAMPADVVRAVLQAVEDDPDRSKWGHHQHRRSQAIFALRALLAGGAR